jgi:hypothetical protein
MVTAPLIDQNRVVGVTVRRNGYLLDVRGPYRRCRGWRGLAAGQRRRTPQAGLGGERYRDSRLRLRNRTGEHVCERAVALVLSRRALLMPEGAGELKSVGSLMMSRPTLSFRAPSALWPSIATPSAPRR